MNGFADIAVVLGARPAPTRQRGDNSWRLEARGDDWAVWLSSGRAVASLIQRAEAGPLTVWAIGETFGYQGRSAGALDRFAVDLSVDRSRPDQLNGRVALVAHDEVSGRWHVLTDRLGTAHVYVASGRNGTAVSTFSPAAAELAGAANLDWEAITGFCALGFFPGDRTWWDDVKIVRPATWSTFDRVGKPITSRRYWNWWYEPRARPIADIVDELDDVLRLAVGDEVGQRSVVLPISGGLDSRLLAGVLSAPLAGRAPVQGLTYGYDESSPESAIGLEVGRAAGIAVEALTVPCYLFDRLGSIVDATEAFTSLTQPRQAGATPVMARLGEVVVGGHWGDVWFDTAGANAGATDDELVDTARYKFSKPGADWLVQHLCVPQLGGQDPEHLVRSMIADELALVPDLGDADMRLKALKTQQWSFRWTLATVRAYQLACPLVLPFYDNRVVDLLLTVPGPLHQGRELQLELLRRRHPEVAAVTWQATGRDLFSPPATRPRELLQRATGKAARTLRRAHPIERNWEIQLRSPDGRPHTERLLRQGPLDELVAPTALDSLLQRFDARVDPAAGYAVDSLVTIAAWAQHLSP